MAYISDYAGTEIDAGIAINETQNTRLTNLETSSADMETLINNINTLNATQDSRISDLESTTVKSAELLNLIYPIGSVYTTSTNADPSSILGGTWTLTDKEFSYASFSVANVFTVNSTNLTSIAGTIIRNNHFFTIYFTLTPKVAITDSTLQMGTLSLSSLGVSSLPSQYYSSTTDGGQASFVWQINASGVLSTVDVIVRGSSTASLSTDYNPRGYCVVPVTTSQMIDSACSRFFWKRTA